MKAIEVVGTSSVATVFTTYLSMWKTPSDIFVSILFSICCLFLDAIELILVIQSQEFTKLETS